MRQALTRLFLHVHTVLNVILPALKLSYIPAGCVAAIVAGSVLVRLQPSQSPTICGIISWRRRLLQRVQ